MTPNRLPVYGLKLVQESSLSCTARLRHLKNAGVAAKLAGQYLKDSAIEQVLTFFLDSQDRVIGLHIQKGTVDLAVVFPAEIFKTALLCNASGLLTVHNHVTEFIKPSREDIRFSRDLKIVAGLLGFRLKDSLIVDNQGNYVSLKNKGLI